MKYSTESKYRKYVKGHGFLSFAFLSLSFGDKYGKKLVDTATKTGIDAAKTASKRVVQKAAEATGDLIVNKIADKITVAGKSKEDDKTKKYKKFTFNQKKDSKLLMTWDCFENSIKMEH